MAYSTDKYTISSGDRNGFYCLYNLVWDFGIDGKYEYFQYIKNLSTNREKAVKKAQSYIGILDYDFNVNFMKIKSLLSQQIFPLVMISKPLQVKLF